MISVDTKKKELVGNFKNGGREWQPKSTPPAVLVHDFPTDAEGKAIPYGVYDMARNEAWVSVGWDHDTPTFAVASIRHWWRARWAAAPTPTRAVGWRVPRHRQGFPCCVHSPLPHVPSPLPRRKRSVLASLASRPLAVFPVISVARNVWHQVDCRQIRRRARYPMMKSFTERSDT